ncbi:MAG: hypothetical protein Alpg2KO_26660 [Alphaproteobacteria bacterium]
MAGRGHDNLPARQQDVAPRRPPRLPQQSGQRKRRSAHAGDAPPPRLWGLGLWLYHLIALAPLWLEMFWPGLPLMAVLSGGVPHAAQKRMLARKPPIPVAVLQLGWVGSGVLLIGVLAVPSLAGTLMAPLLLALPLVMLAQSLFSGARLRARMPSLAIKHRWVRPVLDSLCLAICAGLLYAAYKISLALASLDMDDSLPRYVETQIGSGLGFVAFVISCLLLRLVIDAATLRLSLRALSDRS